MSVHSDDAVSLDQQWNLGFVDPLTDPKKLLRHRLCSKVGGRPAWLDPVHLPTPEQLTCKGTGTPYNFLLQVYAPPLEDTEAAFHRTIFVFIPSKGSELESQGAVKALRCQLPRSNPYYSSDPQAKQQRFPSPQHVSRNDPWEVAAYEAALRAGHSATSHPCGVQLFKEMELFVEPEDQSDTVGAEQQPHIQQLLQNRQDDNNSENDGMENDLIADVEAQQSSEDRTFAHFAAVVGDSPDQVIRYCFEEGAEPLWPSERHVPLPKDIPPCPHCRTPRHFEFQILPQLLHYLDVDPEDPQSPDWASIAIYSCPKSCAVSPQAAQSAYVEEFAWVQVH